MCDHKKEHDNDLRLQRKIRYIDKKINFLSFLGCLKKIFMIDLKGNFLTMNSIKGAENTGIIVPIVEANLSPSVIVVCFTKELSTYS